MESKQTIATKQEQRTPQTKALSDVANHLADIELKIDHMIESIHDSLYRINKDGKNKREDFP